MLTKDFRVSERAKGSATSLSLVPSSASVADDLPPHIGTLAVRLVAKWSRPRLKLRPSGEEEADGLSTDAS
jgi:hypothetical protein